jgi:hypothetical protein
LRQLSMKELLEQRYDKFRNIGKFGTMETEPSQEEDDDLGGHHYYTPASQSDPYSV